MICTTILGHNIGIINKRIRFALQKSDLVEVRLDYLKNPTEKELYSILRPRIKKRIIITCRRKKEGGRHSIEEKKRVCLLKKAIELGAGYIDLESSARKSSIRDIMRLKRETKIIISYHNYNSTPELNKIYVRLKEHKPDIIKIVTYAAKISDNMGAIKLLEKPDIKTISFCMGNKGILSRVLALSFGSYLAYVSLDDQHKAAPGQITLDEAASLYRFRDINKKTKIMGIIGNPVMHSVGRITHNKILKNRNMVYIPFEVSDLAAFFKLARELNFLGCSVTIPHKENVIPYLDETDEHVKKIGAVNTIVLKNKKLIGYNTDYLGALFALKDKTQIKNKNVLVIGAGGAARAIIYALKKESKKIIVTDIDTKKAEKVAKFFGCSFCRLTNIKNLKPDIVINAAPVGMPPKIQQTPYPKRLLHKEMVIFDVVYNPLKTKLIKDAESVGCKTVLGVDMFIYQAIAQLRLLANLDIKFSTLRNETMAALR